MPALKPRWEKFAQLIARGECESNAAAYMAAGFQCRPNMAKRSAYQLLSNPQIQARLDEIRREGEEINKVAREQAITSTGLTRELVIDELLDNLKRAKSGKQFDGATANRACELLGKELGMFVDRSENQNTIYSISDRPLTPEEWADKWTAKQQPKDAPKDAGPGKSPLH
jgi:hypothetical protein